MANSMIPSVREVNCHLAKLVQAALDLVDDLGPLLDQAVSMLQHIAMRFQPRIQLNDTWIEMNGLIIHPPSFSQLRRASSELQLSHAATWRSSACDVPVPSAGASVMEAISCVQLILD